MKSADILFEEYRAALEKNPSLKIFRDEKELNFFRANQEMYPNEIHIGFRREHPMSGWGGRISWMHCWGTIKHIKGSYRCRIFMVDDSSKPERYWGEFNSIEEILKFIMPDFKGLLSYYDDYSYEK
jgi:hypothetical protein